MGGLLFIVYCLCGKIHGTLVCGVFCTPWNPSFVLKWIVCISLCYVRTHGLCTSSVHLYPMRSFDTLSVYHALWVFLYRTTFYAPMVSFMPCGDSYSWSLFHSKESLVSHVIFYGPCGSAVSLGDFLNLCVLLDVMCHPRGFVLLGSFSLWGILRPHGICCARIVPPNTNINVTNLLAYTFAGIPLYIRKYWDLSHHLNILQTVSTTSEQVHMRMFDPYRVTTSSKGHVSHRPCGL